MKLYRIEIEQHHNGLSYGQEVFDVKARTALEALRRSMVAAKKNGFVKSYPLEVKSLEEISSNII